MRKKIIFLIFGMPFLFSSSLQVRIYLNRVIIPETCWEKTTFLLLEVRPEEVKNLTLIFPTKYSNMTQEIYIKDKKGEMKVSKRQEVREVIASPKEKNKERDAVIMPYNFLLKAEIRGLKRGKIKRIRIAIDGVKVKYRGKQYEGLEFLWDGDLKFDLKQREDIWKAVGKFAEAKNIRFWGYVYNPDFVGLLSFAFTLRDKCAENLPLLGASGISEYVCPPADKEALYLKMVFKIIETDKPNEVLIYKGSPILFPGIAKTWDAGTWFYWTLPRFPLEKGKFILEKKAIGSVDTLGEMIVYFKLRTFKVPICPWEGRKWYKCEMKALNEMKKYAPEVEFLWGEFLLYKRWLSHGWKGEFSGWRKFKLKNGKLVYRWDLVEKTIYYIYHPRQQIEKKGGK